MSRTKYTYDENRKGWSTLVWDGTYTNTGEKHRKRLTSKKSSRDLERIVADYIKQRDNDTQTAYTSQSFIQYANQWLETSKAAREINTQNAYKNVINVHLSFLYDVPLSSINHSHFQQAINNQIDHPATCDKIYLTFRQIIKSAIRDKLLPKSAFSDICEDITLPKKIKKAKRPLTENEKTAISRVNLDMRKSAYVQILYHCGLRRGEALALTPNDIDFDKKLISINKVVIFPVDKGEIKPYPKSENGIRNVPIPDTLLDTLYSYVRTLESNEMLFHTKTYHLMTKTGYRRMWESIIKELNKVSDDPITNLTAHIFRHNYCTELCYQIPNISTKMIARLLGDNEKMVLDVYSHIVDEKENISEVLNNIFNYKNDL